MASQVQICNYALIQLGGNLVTDISNPQTNEEYLCANIFDMASEQVMFEGSWTCLTYRATLAQIDSVPLYEYMYAYQLPVDPLCLKVLSIYNGEELIWDWQGEPGMVASFSIENNTLLSNYSKIDIRYVAKITDTSQWNTPLTEAVTSKLFAMLTYPLKGDLQATAAAKQQYVRDRADGLAKDGQQGSKQQTISDDFVIVR